MAIKARFWVQNVLKQAISGGEINRVVQMAPVTRSTGQPGDGENVDWSKFTPSGGMNMTVTQPEAGQWFEDRIGKDVSITIEDVEE